MIAPPEQGQIVRVRHKAWAVTSVTRAGKPADGNAVHRVGLECLSDDALGREIQIIWEREVAPQALESTSLPTPEAGRVDSPEMLQAFLRALRWSSASLAVGDVIQAPFRGGVQIEEYQLAPVLRAARMPRVRLLIADDVGLGKTIEAGLIAQELIHSHRASRMLVLCPAHLKQKWSDEMAEKFGLEFRIIERQSVEQMRREFGPTINPWASFPRLIASIDYLKMEHPRRLFHELSLRRREERASAKPWDLLILDEAHNVAPSGRKNYVRDSERTTLMRGISEQFEHKIFMTATPHNGYRESFTGLLELLDNLRFSRGTELDQGQLSTVTVRRLKADIRKEDGSPRFPARVILPRSPGEDPDLYVELDGAELDVFELLQRYTESRLSKTNKRSERATQFVLTLLKKRALSSPMALRESLVTHTETIGVRDQIDVGDSLFRSLEEREGEDWSDDEEKEEAIEAATSAASQLCQDLTGEEKQWLERMFEVADSFAGLHVVQPDAKARALLSWIETHLRGSGEWNGERVIIFTEYKHTLEYLSRILEDAGYGDAVATIMGGMPDKNRNAVNDAFQSPDDETPVRILLATDAASEGADFQKHCRNLIHYEIPWNPVRLEQRNGRVDRHGQRASEVRIHHFVFSNQEDSEFLSRIVEKVEAIRSDLGSVGSLIADSVRLRALGGTVSLDDIDRDARRKLARQEMALDAQDGEDVAGMIEVLNHARQELGIDDASQLDLLERALELEGCGEALERAEGGRFILTSVPGTWTECRRYVTTISFEQELTFDREDARDNDRLAVVHLDHPLMRRAMATFRVQMWSDAQATDQGLARVSVAQSDKLKGTVTRAWGRLVLLGPEHNRLHEGLVHLDASLTNGGPAPYEIPPDLPLSGVVDDGAALVRDNVSLPIGDLTDQLRDEAQRQAKELEAVLAARGKAAEKHARGLATDRMAAIRTTIRRLEKEAGNPAQYLPGFEPDELDQKDQDLQALRDRLEALAEERETEPKRQKALYRVAEIRVYPVALELLLPGEMTR